MAKKIVKKNEQAAKPGAQPKVSFLIPSLNEDRHIGCVLETLYGQDYPKDRIEVVIADGNSRDSTVAVIKGFAKKHKAMKVVLLKNPSGNTAIGRNICLKAATGKYIFNYSSHAYAEKNLVSTLVRKLEKAPRDVAAYGVSSNPPDDELNFSGQCIQACFSTFWGGGGLADQNIHLKEERQVRSVAFSAYRREIFDEVGDFDEDLWCGQDGEFNLRINKAGKKIIYTPDSGVSLQKRDSPERFFRQMYKYGIAAAIRIKKHPDSFRLYYILPALGAAFLILLFLASIFSRHIADAFWSLLGLYIVIGMVFAFIKSKTLMVSLAAPLFYFIIHFGYGIGYIDGWIMKKRFRK